jgi:hypothetical protein
MLVFMFWLCLVGEKCMQYFRQPFRKRFIYVIIAIYYLSIIFKIVTSLVKGPHG